MAVDQQGNIQKQLRSMRRMLIALSVAVAVILVGLLLFVPIDERVQASGVVRAGRDTHLHSPEDGILKKVHVGEGESVTKGQPVVSLDELQHQSELKQIEANVEKARAELELQRLHIERTAKLPLPKEFWHMQEDLSISKERVRQSEAELNSATQLFNKGLISKQDLERMRLAWEIVKSEKDKAEEKTRILNLGLEGNILSEGNATIENARAALRAFEIERELCLEAIARCIIRAPEDGVVTLLAKTRPGERVSKGEDLVHLSHGAPTRVDIFAGESQYHKVRPGQRVYMKSNAFDTLRYGYIEGHVVRAGIEPSKSAPSSGTPTGTSGAAFRVVAEVDYTPQDLVIGSTVEAKIITQRVPLWRLLLPQTLQRPGG